MRETRLVKAETELLQYFTFGFEPVIQDSIGSAAARAPEVPRALLDFPLHPQVLFGRETGGFGGFALRYAGNHGVPFMGHCLFSGFGSVSKAAFLT